MTFINICFCVILTLKIEGKKFYTCNFLPMAFTFGVIFTCDLIPVNPLVLVHTR